MIVFVRLLHPFFVCLCFLDHSPASGISNYIHQVTSKRQRCTYVAFIGKNKGYSSTSGCDPFHSSIMVNVILIAEDPTVNVKCRTAINALFLIFEFVSL